MDTPEGFPLPDSVVETSEHHEFEDPYIARLRVNVAHQIKSDDPKQVEAYIEQHHKDDLARHNKEVAAVNQLQAELLQNFGQGLTVIDSTEYPGVQAIALKERGSPRRDEEYVILDGTVYVIYRQAIGTLNRQQLYYEVDTEGRPISSQPLPIDKLELGSFIEAISDPSQNISKRVNLTFRSSNGTRAIPSLIGSAPLTTTDGVNNRRNLLRLAEQGAKTTQAELAANQHPVGTR